MTGCFFEIMILSFNNIQTNEEPEFNSFSTFPSSFKARAFYQDRKNDPNNINLDHVLKTTTELKRTINTQKIYREFYRMYEIF